MSEAEETTLKIKIEEASTEIIDARRELAEYKRKMLSAEDRLIASQLRQESLEEQLRLIVSQKVNVNLTDRQREIKDFKDKLESVLEKIK